MWLLNLRINCRGDADVVKAEAINEQTTDTSGYTITIPSEISFSTDTTNFDISAGLDKSTQIIITASSQNGFNLTNRDDTIPYSISDNLITLSNSRPDISNTVSQSLNIFMDKSKNPMYGGDYKDTLTFNIQEKQLYTLNVNGLLDGNTVSWLNGYGTFGIKINGRTINNLTDFYQSQAEGTTYEIYNIKATDGKHYIGDAIIKGTFDSPYQEINLKFDTNKLTLNYHADGAQSWNDFQDIVQDVSNKDVVYSEAKKYGDTFDSQDGLVNVNRLTKKGYTAVANTWTIKEAGNKKVMDNVGLAKSQDVADYCGVLDEFEKNDTTIDLYPIWTPNTYTLTYDLDGGSFNASTTQLFKYGSEDAISSETPNKAGYSFAGWKWGDVTMQPGDTIPKEWGNFTLTAQWEKALYPVGTVLNIEGSDYIVMSQTDDDKYLVMRKDSIGNKKFQSIHRADGQNQNTYEGSEIDNYLENDWYNSLSSTMKSAIQPTSIKQASYATFGDPDSIQETGFNGQVYNTIDRHAFLPSVSEIGKAVDLKNPDKLEAFLNGDRFWTRDSFQRFNNSVESLGAHIGGLIYYYVYNTYGVRPAFVIDLSKIDYIVTGTVNYK